MFARKEAYELGTPSLMERTGFKQMPWRESTLLGIDGGKRRGLVRATSWKERSGISLAGETSTEILTFLDFVDRVVRKYLTENQAATTVYSSTEGALFLEFEVIPLMNVGNRITTVEMSLPNNTPLNFRRHAVALVTNKNVHVTYPKTSDVYYSNYPGRVEASISLLDTAGEDESIRFVLVLEADNRDLMSPGMGLPSKKFLPEGEYKFSGVALYRFLDPVRPDYFSVQKRLIDVLYGEGKIDRIQRFVALAKARAEAVTRKDY